MSYLKFDKNRMVNLEYSLNRAILRTNRRGAYHLTTLVECNTRKQHGLLVMPVPAIDDSNHVILSSFDETVIQHGAEFNLGVHKYDGDNYSPMGHKYIREFDCESLPRTIYRVGGVVLSKEKMFSLIDNSIYIRYTLLDAHSPTILRFKPFLAFREINSLTSENDRVNKGYKEVTNGISTCMYIDYPNLHMQFSKKVKFIFDPTWYKGIEYKTDMEQGFPYKEDLYVPGYFELPIKKGETIVFCAGDKEIKPQTLLKLFEDGIKVRTPRSSLLNCLVNSAHQFYFRPNKNELFLLEGYPWFKVDARIQFMTLPGLTMLIGKDESFEEVMDTAIPYLRKFMNGEQVSGHLHNIEAPDVLLWVIWSLCKFNSKHKDIYLNKYASLTVDIIRYLLKNSHPKNKVLENGLLYTDGKQQAATWMNGMSDGHPIVMRTGCIVDTNALWYNALMFTLDVAKEIGDVELEDRLSALTVKVKDAFNETFVNDAGYLFDYVDGNYVNWSVRPNMLTAISVDYTPLDKKISRSMLDIATKELLTPKGLRTLSPKSEGYSPYYQGTQFEKDYAAFNGAAWPGLLASYADAYYKIFQKSGIFAIDRLLVGLEEEMANNCIGTFSQVYDGNPPYDGNGAPSYSLNVSGVLFVLDLLRSLENEY
ncbi:4-alpha-glucanotransferase [Dysgonomonas sp. 216]|uniref:glycogen debranching enzyme N-terminal domain-containing protein n=1 Tax=Dysgonomonas sp. 216 TaxID=2302934 RepID=UPI0013D39076|nr:glycogen debranching enzyme N-terminal domain-containing protein [Dysgonomonas sp. 216]NDW19383.1 4-alpha-glucanotransferase [Dysgonomonas sp. 216]